MIASTIGRRGQVIIPLSIRRSLNLKEGDRIAFIRQGDEIILQPLTHTLLDLRGSVPIAEPHSFAAIREQVVQEHARKVAQDED